MMHPLRITKVFFYLLLGMAAAGPAVAQEQKSTGPTARFAALEALNASYQRQQHELDCRRIADLTAFAEKTNGPEAEAAYRQLFGLAITQDVCPAAMEAAGRCLATASYHRDTRSVAALVQLLGRSKKGEHDQALADLDAIFHPRATAGQAAPAPDFDLALAVGEAFLQRLIHDGRYDIARKLCGLACDADTHATLKEHFEDRMARLDLHGKPAPPIAGKDVDGKPVSLVDFKGKVVLVDFWATWCPPCVASIPALEALAQKYSDKGFVILGVNVDAMHEDVKDQNAVLQGVRRFLVNHRVTWINLLNGHGPSDFVAAYHVEQIPANFLIGRDGKIVALEQHGEMLEKAVAQALVGHAKTGDQP
jgi:thiol-disulfide isomerase/thioredoxin